MASQVQLFMCDHYHQELLPRKQNARTYYAWASSVTFSTNTLRHFNALIQHLSLPLSEHHIHEMARLASVVFTIQTKNVFC